MSNALPRKIAAVLIGASLVTGALGAAGRADAAGLTTAEAAVIAGFTGLVVGGMIAEHAHRHHAHDTWEQHVRRCEARYVSYDAESDTYVGYDGRDHRCRL